MPAFETGPGGCCRWSQAQRLGQASGKHMGTTPLSTSLAGRPGLKAFGVTAAMTAAQFQLCTPRVLRDAWFRDPEAQNMQ